MTCVAVLTLSPIAYAQQTGGTADEAEAMLVKAVAPVKADEANALHMFNKMSDGMIVAIGSPNAKQLLGKDTRTLEDPTGKMLGAELCRRAEA